MSETTSPRLLVIGAHPDDADFYAGGLAALYRQQDYPVRFVSVTDGSAGHHEMSGSELATRRAREAQRVARLVGLEYEIWDNPDGELQVTLATRQRIIRLIRQFKPDLVLTHRPNDYHPDHRYTSQMVMDAAYMVTVPSICRDVPRLERDPVIMYMHDRFTRPYPFDPTVLVPIDSVWQTKIEMLHCHESQVYEWLPYNEGFFNEVPTAEQPRKEMLAGWVRNHAVSAAEYPQLSAKTFGTREVDLVEPFEHCEYGCRLDVELLPRLFPFGR